MSWKEEYLKMVGCVNPRELEIEKAQLLKIQNMPRFLYKYRPASDFAIENLRTNTVYLNSPFEYNDPFECVEYVDIDKMYDINLIEFKDEFISMLIGNYPMPADIIEGFKESSNPVRDISEYTLSHYENYSVDNVKKTLDIYDKVSNEVLESVFRQKNRKMQQIIKVSSFCESPKQLLMWSHYADYHKGFCIEYDLSKWSITDVRRRLLCPVIYVEKLFDATKHYIRSILNDDFNNIYPIISCATKSKEWSYEEEWRFIFNFDPHFDTQNYPMDCQCRIYMGLRIEPTIEKKIIEICKVNGLTLFKAKQSFDKYELNFETIFTPDIF